MASRAKKAKASLVEKTLEEDKEIKQMIEEVFEHILDQLNQHIQSCKVCQESEDDLNCCEEGKRLIKQIEDFGTGEE